MKPYLTLLLLSIILSSPPLLSQSPYMTSEIDIQAGWGSNAPFWQTTNRHGIKSFEPNSGYLRTGVFQPYHPDHKKVNYRYGAELYLGTDGKANASIQQLYVEGKLWNCLNMMVGMQERRHGLHDPLSTGDWGWSGNARPMPGIAVGIFDLWAIPGTKNWLSIKGRVQFDWYIDNLYQKETVDASQYLYNQDILMHHSSLYVKIGDGKFPLSLTLALEHYVQWGSWSSAPWLGGRQPASFIDLLRVMTGGFGSSTAVLGDQVNSLGNHLGSENIQLDYKIKDYTLSFYYQYFLDDASLATFANFPDGSWALALRSDQKRWVSGAIVEYIQSYYQSGPIHRWQKDEGINPGSTSVDDGDVNIGANDNYYNNYLYIEGWSHQGHTNGNPLLISPGYNRDGDLALKNNRIMGIHAAIEGYLHPDLHYKLMATYTKNWGTYYNPYFKTKENISAMIDLNYTPHQLKGWTFSAGFAMDRGDLIGNNYGLNLSIKKHLSLSTIKQDNNHSKSARQ